MNERILPGLEYLSQDPGNPAQLSCINLNAAGIDIGSTSHYVAVPPGRVEKNVREFKCFTPDLNDLALWLKQCNIKTVAMESTGVYWLPIFQVLEDHGFEVLLVDAHKLKNVPGKKTDYVDCQWIQELHTFGLLHAAFVPEKSVAILRSYWRQRNELVQCCSRQILLMQKALDLMNLLLHRVISDISGMTGMKIIRAILKGVKDPKTLAKMRHTSIKSSEKDIIKALTGNFREEHLFSLQQAVETYDFYQGQMKECDSRIDTYLSTLEGVEQSEEKSLKPKALSRRKNQPYFDLRSHLFRLTGVDITAINGIDALTAFTVLSECGFDLKEFATVKQFCSWLTLCPNNRITGGKIKSRRTRKSSNRAAQALRIAASSLHHNKSSIGAFYRRIKAKKGPAIATTATAHKLARLIYAMVKNGTEYVEAGEEYYEQKYQARIVKNLTKTAAKFGYELVKSTKVPIP